MLKRHVEIAETQGIPSENCFVLAPGDVLNINTKGATVIKEGVPASDIYLDSSLSDVDSNVLKERRKMADEGLVSVTYFVNKRKEIINHPIVTLSGFATPDKAKQITDKITAKCTELYINQTKNKDKICLIFSDGAPTECSDADLVAQVKHMEHAGIKVIGIGIGFPNISKYYADYANGNNLKEMLDIVANILKDYVIAKKD